MPFPNNVVLVHMLAVSVGKEIVEIYHCYFPLHKRSVQINVATSEEVVHHRQLSSK